MRASAFRPVGGVRILSMITMLVVLGLIIQRAADPATWAWLAGDQDAAAKQNAAADKAPAAKPAVAKTNAEHVVPGPTDEDIEEQDAAQEEFMALTDGGLQQGVEEMPAYWRLFGWVQHQSTDQLKKRALAQLKERENRELVFNDFVRNPDELRGKLVRLDLNVRQVHKYPATTNKVGVTTVYEIRGWTTESKAWLYFLLTPELPTGMPTGTDVVERVTFTGYFYKLQGYLEAGAGPRDKPLRAPLLIGRVTWKPSELGAAQNGPQDWPWLWWVGGVVVVFGILRMGLWMYSRLQPPSLHQEGSFDRESAHKSASVRNWLENVEEDGGHPRLTDTDEPAPWNGTPDRLRNLTDFHNN